MLFRNSKVSFPFFSTYNGRLVNIFLIVCILLSLLSFWLCWVFVAVRLFSSCDEQGLFSGCGVWASHVVAPPWWSVGSGVSGIQ